MINNDIIGLYWFSDTMVLLSYAPLAHLAERLRSFIVFANGGKIGLYSGVSRVKNIQILFIFLSSRKLS